MAEAPNRMALNFVVGSIGNVPQSVEFPSVSSIEPVLRGVGRRRASYLSTSQRVLGSRRYELYNRSALVLCLCYYMINIFISVIYN
jgi:hypothetical protein